LPSKVLFHNTTIRDGEQTPGVVFRRDEKVEIAKKLSEVGVDRIEAGMPAVSQDPFHCGGRLAGNRTPDGFVRNLFHRRAIAKILDKEDSI